MAVAWAKTPLNPPQKHRKARIIWLWRGQKHRKARIIWLWRGQKHR
ncbi:hypothetical protein ACOWLS_07940 [Helicobacter pylori]